MPMNVLSIQSHVAYGRVGNGAAAFPLERMGFEVWRVNTVQFSNHTGYGGWTGQIFPADQVRALIRGIAERGVLARCDAVLSGYIGDASLGAVIMDAVEQVRAANPKAIYACDPVMGDSGPGLYVQPSVPAFMKDRAAPAADILTPNLFELEQLVGRPLAGRDRVIEAAQEVMARGPRCILVTSILDVPDAPREIEMLAVAKGEAWRVATPFLEMDPAPNGAGDAVAALFLANRLKGHGLADSLGRAAASIFAVMEVTRAAGQRELQLIAAQDQMLVPERHFAVEPVS